MKFPWSRRKQLCIMFRNDRTAGYMKLDTENSTSYMEHRRSQKAWRISPRVVYPHLKARSRFKPVAMAILTMMATFCLLPVIALNLPTLLNQYAQYADFLRYIPMAWLGFGFCLVAVILVRGLGGWESCSICLASEDYGMALNLALDDLRPPNPTNDELLAMTRESRAAALLNLAIQHAASQRIWLLYLSALVFALAIVLLVILQLWQGGVIHFGTVQFGG